MLQAGRSQVYVLPFTLEGEVWCVEGTDLWTSSCDLSVDVGYILLSCHHVQCFSSFL
jgi:hypothetical protein